MRAVGLVASVRFTGVLEYRPNWGYHGLDHPREQAGAPVLVWGQDWVEPGDQVRAVIVPMYPEAWQHVAVGDELTMYEGHRVCGVARVIWRSNTDAWPISDSDLPRCRSWTRSTDEIR